MTGRILLLRLAAWTLCRLWRCVAQSPAWLVKVPRVPPSAWFDVRSGQQSGFDLDIIADVAY